MSEAENVQLNTNAETLTDSEKLIATLTKLSNELESINYSSPVEYVYNPLIYAKTVHDAFISKYFDNSQKKILFLGMNPGPWGMCQTGIAFGDSKNVKEWFQMTGEVVGPITQHPKKKIEGLNCHKREESGKRIWNFFQKLCGTPENFFKNAFVYNFCPLAFVGVNGENITPENLKKEIKNNKTVKDMLNDINKACEKALIDIITTFNFKIIIGIGNFAQDQASKALKSNQITGIKVYKIPHPSPLTHMTATQWEVKTFQILDKEGLLNNYIENSSEVDALRKEYSEINQNDSKRRKISSK